MNTDMYSYINLFYTTCRQNGNCTRYIVSNNRNLCDQIFRNTERFVYVPNIRLSQKNIHISFADEELRRFIDSIDPHCLDLFTRALCVHYYLPCGNSTFRHVPQFLCPDTCHYIRDDLCRKAWREATVMFNLVQPFNALPDCDNPAAIVSFLNLSADCCSTGGVTIPSNVTVTPTTFTTNTTYIATSSSLSRTQIPTPTLHDIDVVGISVGSTVTVLIVLAFTLISLAVFFLYLRKRKVTNFQDAENYEARYTKNSFKSTAKVPSAGVHNDCALPVQSMHTHIEQLSNVLIPKTRIQLIEILGQGITLMQLIVKLIVIVSYMYR